MTILLGDCRAILPTLDAESVRCCVTSPPYWGLRDYGTADQLGLEPTPEAYVAQLVSVFREVRRVLADDGTLWLNLGDSYAGSNASQGGDGSASRLGPDAVDSEWTRSQAAMRLSGVGVMKRGAGLKPKDLVGIPWRVAFALQADGWYLRSDIIWAKPNPMPESVTDRPTKSHEYVFLLSKSQKYFYDAAAIAEPGVTVEKENYPARAHITGRGGQGAADARGSDRDRSGGFPPRISTDRKALRSDIESRHRSSVPGGQDLRASPGYLRNARTVWTIPTQPTPDAHFATFPEALAERCIAAGSAPGDTVLDPFFGSGTVGKVAERLGRKWVGIELNPAYVGISEKKTAQRGIFAGLLALFLLAAPALAYDPRPTLPPTRVPTPSAPAPTRTATRTPTTTPSPTRTPTWTLTPTPTTAASPVSTGISTPSATIAPSVAPTFAATPITVPTPGFTPVPPWATPNPAKLTIMYQCNPPQQQCLRDRWTLLQEIDVGPGVEVRVFTPVPTP